MRWSYRFVLGGVFSTLLLLAAAGPLNAQEKAPVPDAAAAGGSAKGGERTVRLPLSIGQDAGGQGGGSGRDDRGGAEAGGRIGRPVRAAEDRAGDRLGGGRGGDGAAGGRRTGGTVRRAGCELKAETLLAAAREARATAQQKAVAEAALQLVKRLDGRERSRIAPECLRSRPLGGSEIPAV